MPIFGAPNIEKLAKRKGLHGLIKALRHKDAQVREGAAQSLGELNDVAGIEPLLGATADSDWRVRDAARKSLRKLKSRSSAESVLPPLLTALRDPSSACGDRVLTWETRKAIQGSVIDLLGDMKDSRVTDALAEWLGVGDVEHAPLYSFEMGDSESKKAIGALAQFGDSRFVVAALRRFKIDFWHPMDDLMEDTASHWESLNPGLADVRHRQIEYRGQRVSDVSALREWPEFLGLFKEYPKTAIPGLVDCLGYVGHGGSWVRYLAEQILPSLRDKVAVDERVRVVRALGKLGDPVPPLIKALQDKQELLEVRGEAATALGELGDERAVEPLIGAIADISFKAIPALEKLGKLGDARVIEQLIAALQSGSLSVREREQAAEALGRCGDGSAVEPLIKALLGDERIRGVAAIALGALGDPRAIEPLVNVFREGTLSARGWAGRLIDLGDQGVEALVDAVRTIYAEEGLHDVVASALRERGHLEAAERVPLTEAEREAMREQAAKDEER